MTFIAKPKINYAGQAKNALGLSVHDYEGTISTLCAGSAGAKRHILEGSPT